VVRGGVEPPTFRFSGGCAGPRESATGRLCRPCDVLAALGVQVHRHVSTAVVSTALAGSTISYGGWLAPVVEASFACPKLDNSTVRTADPSTTAPVGTSLKADGFTDRDRS
jgi:hypothetical protein